jgi:hypothetical protein
MMKSPGFERIAENLTWPDREDEKKQELLAQKETKDK